MKPSDFNMAVCSVCKKNQAHTIFATGYKSTFAACYSCMIKIGCDYVVELDDVLITMNSPDGISYIIDQRTGHEFEIKELSRDQQIEKLLNSLCDNMNCEDYESDSM